MQNGVFSGLTGALTAEHRLATITNNLANVNTTGYKNDKLSFKDTMIHFAHDFIREPLADLRSEPLFPESQILARVRPAVSRTDFTQGALEKTDNNLDIAIEGNGFFNVLTPQGQLVTKNGAFTRNAEGTLVTKQGFPVVGDGGPITIPEDAKTIHISLDGNIYADNAQIGTLQITAYSNASQSLEKVGLNLYKVREGATAEELPAFENGVTVRQGYIEKANVNVVEEMVKMIEAQRFFEMNTKMMQTADTFDREAISKVGKPR